MKTLKTVKCMVLVLAGTICTGSAGFGGDTPVRTRTSRVAADVRLTAGGTLTGQLVDRQGRALDGATVRVTYRGRTVARTTTNGSGAYRVTGLRGGLHAVVTPQGTSQPVRFWTAESAPQQARASLLTVSGNEVKRGQFGGLFDASPVELTTLGVSIAALVVASQTQDDVDSLNKDVNSLTQNVDAMAAADAAALDDALVTRPIVASP